MLKAVFSQSLVDTTPLFLPISRCVDANMMGAVAEEYRKGRF